MRLFNPRRIIKTGLLVAFIATVATIFAWQNRLLWASLAYPPIPEEDYALIETAVSSPSCELPKRKRALIAAMAWKESTFHGDSISGGGAVGKLQLLRGTAFGVANEHQKSGLNAQTLTDPGLNYILGTCYIHDKLVEMGAKEDSDFDDPRIVAAALMAYNAGSGAGRAYLAGGRPESSYARRIKEAEQVYTQDFSNHDQRVASGSGIDLLTNIRGLVHGVFLRQIVP